MRRIYDAWDGGTAPSPSRLPAGRDVRKGAAPRSRAAARAAYLDAVSAYGVDSGEAMAARLALGARSHRLHAVPR